MAVTVDSDLQRVDWDRAKADLDADAFDNGRSAAALRRSFEASAHVAFAWDDERLVGMARVLSDGVCNAYLVDVWTASSHRHRGIGSKMVRYLVERVPGQHVGLQTSDAGEFYRQLGFRPQPEFFGIVSGSWLGNDGNRGVSNASDVHDLRQDAVGVAVAKPWGSYWVLEEGKSHKVKRLEVRPGGRLSYQRHERRAEHWFVVSGSAEVVLDGDVRQLGPGDTIDIPIRAAHRVSNAGDRPLVFIEVQVGHYFGEDDIERLDDDYGRVGSG